MAFPTPPDTHELQTVSELAIEYINYHLKAYEAHQDRLRALKKEPNSAFGLHGVPQLQEVAAAGIVKSLRQDLGDEVVRVIVNSVPTHLLVSVIKDPRIHYSSFRKINAKRVEDKAAGEGDEVDQWIQSNEKWLRVDGTNWGLVTLEDAKAIFPTATHTASEITIPRRQPPSTSFCFLDQKRPSSISILPTTERFIETFNRVTDNCLNGLDWTNVFLAGGMPLNVLLCTDPSLDSTFASSDLDLYIYGLNPAQANAKVRHIYSVWSTNVGAASVAAGMCIRNSKTVNFLGCFPQRRVQIVLKIVATPAEVLLNFDLDPCAIGFDGTRVLMLPRAARALETGYTTFTMNLLYGHHLSDRRETQELRVYKYGSRGFGIRILSCTMASLTLDTAARLPHEAAYSRARRNYDQKPGPTILTGLKAVKRVAFAAEDMVRRFVLNEIGGVVSPEPEESDMRSWAKTASGKVPICSFRQLDALKQHIGQPGGRSGIKSFELFLRHCAAWKLECEGRLKIDYNDFADTYQTEGAYDDLPNFSWDAGFNADYFKRDIDMYNIRLHRNMLGLFDHLEDASMRWEECQEDKMLIMPARIVHGATLEDVMTKHIAIPVFIGANLADHFVTVCHAAGATDPLFHLHTGKAGNLIARLWLIGTETMWARIDRTIDEVFETLWTFFHIQQLAPGHICGLGMTSLDDDDDDDDEYNGDNVMQTLLHEHFERRIVRPIKARTAEARNTIGFFSWPDDDEVRRFDLWMRQHPREVHRGLDTPFGLTGTFDEDMNNMEPDEELYWGSSDERDDGVGEEERRGKRKRMDSTLLQGEKWARV